MRALLVAWVGLAAMAGCFGGDAPPNERTFSASGGVVSAGWAYDGSGVIGQDAELTGTTLDDANTGTIHAELLIDDEPWVIHFNSFAQAEGKEFQDGGIEHGIDEHGDTGVADASIPKIHALVAAWGSATVSRNGVPVADEPWSAHLMVSQDTVRVDGGIMKADGAAPYDPSTPGDARRVEGDPQAFLFVKHPQGETFSRGALTSYLNLTCSAPQCTQAGEIPVEDGATLVLINATARPDGQFPLAVGRGVTVTFTDANGAALASIGLGDVVTGGPVPANTGFASVKLGADFVGPITASVSGDGAFAVLLEATATYADRPFIVITWDEPTVS